MFRLQFQNMEHFIMLIECNYPIWQLIKPSARGREHVSSMHCFSFNKTPCSFCRYTLDTYSRTPIVVHFQNSISWVLSNFNSIERRQYVYFNFDTSRSSHTCYPQFAIRFTMYTVSNPRNHYADISAIIMKWWKTESISDKSLYVVTTPRCHFIPWKR